MSFFSGITNNLTHGGVKVKLTSPTSFSHSDTKLPLTITISSKDSSQQINKIHVELVRSVDSADSITSTSSSSSDDHTVLLADADDSTLFTLAPNETKTIQLELVLNPTAMSSDTNGSTSATISKAIQMFGAVMNSVNQVRYSYDVRVSADVEGIALDPSDSNAIQMTGENVSFSPGNFNIRL